jgi:hypothetical protein
MIHRMAHGRWSPKNCWLKIDRVPIEIISLNFLNFNWVKIRVSAENHRFFQRLLELTSYPVYRVKASYRYIGTVD